MSDKKTFNEWEIEQGVLVIGTLTKDLEKQMTKEEFEAVAYKDGKFPHGVNWTDRTKFLENNGYAVNRKNMVDSSLSAKPPKKK